MKVKIYALLSTANCNLVTENFQLINLSREQLKALTVLSYSDNEELQRTAAFFFSEISEQCEFALIYMCVGIYSSNQSLQTRRK